MNFRPHLLGLGLLIASFAFARAESPATNTPPGPVQAPGMNPEPATPAPPQDTAAKSAPGAQAPSGTNGTTQSGTPVTKAPNTPHKKKKNPSAAPEPATAVASNPPAAPAKSGPPVLDNYLKDLNDTLLLSANEKSEIQNYYLTDAPKLNSILNDPTLSPLQQEQQVSDLRDKRNARIEALLEDTDRRHEFFKVEATYRVALIDAAADGTLVPVTTPPPAPAPSDIAPGQAEPIPTKNSGAP